MRVDPRRATKTGKRILPLFAGVVIALAVMICGGSTAWAAGTNVGTYSEFVEAVGNEAVDTINVTGDFALESDVTIGREVTVTGAVYSIDTTEFYSIIIGTGGDVTVSGDLTVTGWEWYNNGIIWVTSDGVFTLEGNATIINTREAGYGVYAEGVVTINGGTITATEQTGRGVYVLSGGSLAMNSGTISATGQSGTGVSVGSGGSLAMNSGTITATGESGFGVFVSSGGSLAMNSGTISATGTDSRGVYNWGTINIGGSAIISGDIQTQGGTVNITSSTSISLNGSVFCTDEGSDNRVFITTLPSPVSITPGQEDTVELTGDADVGFEIYDATTPAALNASINGSTVTLAPLADAEAGTYNLVLGTTVNIVNPFAPVGETTPLTVNLTIPVTVLKKQLTIGGSFAPENKIYDGGIAAVIDASSLTLEGIVGSDNVSLNAVAAFVDANVGSSKAVSLTGASSLGGAQAGNYILSLDGAPTATADITKKVLTVTAEEKSKVYGAADPEFTVSYSGFVAGEDESALGGSLSVIRESVEEPGSYAITPSGLTSVNYDITFIDGTLTILSTNANLSELALSSGTLSPSFDSETTGYTASVGNSVSSITVTPTTDDADATITVKGTAVTSGQASDAISLNVGSNTINVVVTAKDEVTTKTYTIIVTRPRASTGGEGSDGGSGGGGPTQTPAPTPTVNSNGNITTAPELDKNTGVATINIDTATLNTAFEKAEENSDGKTVDVVIPAVEGAKAYEPTLPASALSSTDGNWQMEIKTDIAEVTLPGNMLAEEDTAGANNVSLTIAQADLSAIEDEETRNRIGDRPVIQLNLKVDGKPYAWSNENAPVTVSIPYKPTAQELADPEHITVWYIDGKGDVVEVPSGKYDPATGTVTFSTTHFSNYAVVYVTKTFDDLGNVAWAKKSIEVLASKGILKGTSETEYAPGTNITRADFLYFLVRTLGVDAKVDGNFDDINSDAYYYKEIAIAKALGITSGTGNNKFSPDASITRQDMMVLTERVLRMLKILEVQGTASDLDRFADKSLVAAYAVNSVAAVVNKGLIVGSGDKINPLSNTTRAEAAAFLYRIYNKY